MLINISLAVEQVNLVLTALNQMQTNAGNAMAAIQQQAQQQVKQPDFPPIDPEPAAGTD